jgi:molybdopterin/thiamine biosynthesis adenylyltransferase
MKRPQIKISRKPVRIGTELVRVGGVVHTLAFDVTDSDGWLWVLVNLLDGSRTVAEVTAALRVRFPHRSPNDVPQAIEGLRLTGHLVDADEPEPVGLTMRERERYSRSRELLQAIDTCGRTSTWAQQLALKGSKAVVIGLGGVGTVVANAFTASGVGQVHCVDYDVVTLSDLNRQTVYTERDRGLPKVEAAVRHLRERNSDILVTGEQRDVDGPDAVTTVVTGFDLVALAADSPPELRSWTNRACVDLGIPWVWAGYDGPLMTIGVYRPTAGPCFDCAKAAERERKARLTPRTEWLPAIGEIPPHAANFATVTIAGSFAAEAAMSLIIGPPRVPVNRVYQFNLVDRLERSVIGPETSHPRCPVCR